MSTEELKMSIKDLFDHLLETCVPEEKKEGKKEEEDNNGIICENCGKIIPKNYLEILDEGEYEIDETNFLKKRNIFQKIKGKSPIKLGKNKKQESWHSSPKASKEERKQYRRSSSWSNPIYKGTSSPSPKTKKNVTWEENTVFQHGRKSYYRSASQPDLNKRKLSRKNSLQKISDPPIQS